MSNYSAAPLNLSNHIKITEVKDSIFNHEARERSTDLTTEKKILNISRIKSSESISSIITEHFSWATVSNILTLFEKSELEISDRSANVLMISLNTSWVKRMNGSQIRTYRYRNAYRNDTYNDTRERERVRVRGTNFHLFCLWCIPLNLYLQKVVQVPSP